MANRFTYQKRHFSVGDTINVSLKVVEGEKIRSQIFTGLLIAIGGRQENQSFTVRKIGAHGIGVEKIFPVMSPDITNITLKSRGKVRRAKLYYLRSRTGRSALRVKSVKTKKSTQKTSTAKHASTSSRSRPSSRTSSQKAAKK